jgi:hypothetical protein
VKRSCSRCGRSATHYQRGRTAPKARVDHDLCQRCWRGLRASTSHKKPRFHGEAARVIGVAVHLAAPVIAWPLEVRALRAALEVLERIAPGPAAHATEAGP